MARSLLRQLEQVRRAATYNDDVADVNLPGVAEPTVSGSLEEDTNVLRSLFKQLKGTSTWFENLGTYTDPSATTTPKQMTLSGIKGHTLDAKTIILAVANDQGGSGYAVTTASSGVTLSGVTTRYATAADHTGLPIYSAGYFDSGRTDNICRVDIVNMDTDSEIQDGSGHTIYGKLWDSALVGGTGSGDSVFVKFYANGAECNMVAGVSSIAVVYPQRKRLTDMEEYEWLRTDFISSWEGDVELIEDIQNLWAFTGASDNDDRCWPMDKYRRRLSASNKPNDFKDRY